MHCKRYKMGEKHACPQKCDGSICCGVGVGLLFEPQLSVSSSSALEKPLNF